MSQEESQSQTKATSKEEKKSPHKVVYSITLVCAIALLLLATLIDYEAIFVKFKKLKHLKDVQDRHILQDLTSVAQTNPNGDKQTTLEDSTMAKARRKSNLQRKSSKPVQKTSIASLKNKKSALATNNKAVASEVKVSRPKRLNSMNVPIDEVIQNFNGDLTPPEYCYTSPAGKRVHPTEHQIKDKLSLQNLKKVLEVLSGDNPCMVLDRYCANNTYVKGTDLKFYTQYFDKKSKLSEDEKLKRFPDLMPGDFGTCAIVGNADNVLKGKFGKEIDSHDFVARFNVQLKGFEFAVGTKTDGLFEKKNYRKTPHYGNQMPSKYHMYPKSFPPNLQSNSRSGKPSLAYGIGIKHWRRKAGEIYNTFKKEKHLRKGKPTGGFARVMSLVELTRLGICTRFDIYGFSSGGGKYFVQKFKVKTDHIIQVEHLTYRLLMATGIKGKICVYGD